jgi:hypothetical protein
MDVNLYPVTGPKHQLRKHMKHIGHAIRGDKRYARYPKRAPTTILEPSSTTDESNNAEQQVKADVLLATKLEDNPHVRLCLWATEITPTSKNGKGLKCVHGGTRLATSFGQIPGATVASEITRDPKSQQITLALKRFEFILQFVGMCS